MKTYQQHTVQQYLDVLSARTPVPGGGSAAALSAALGVSLISMVANYSLGKSSPKIVDRKIRRILARSEAIRVKLMVYVDLDAQAYLGVVAARKGSSSEYSSALRQAQRVPRAVAKLCYEAITLTPGLVVEGNKNLLSDIEIAVELLQAAFKSSLINIAVNQS